MTSFTQDYSTELTEPTYPEPTPDIRKEADFYVKQIKLVAFNGAEYDLTALHSELLIYEDLFSHSISGHISINDAFDLPQLLPIIGEEKLSIIFTRPDEKGRGLLDYEWKRVFDVYKLSDLRQSANKETSQSYTLHFVSRECVKNLSATVADGYEDTISNIVTKIYKEYLEVDKPIEVEDTMFTRKLTIPGYHPFEAIALLAQQAISASGNKSCFLFWEDVEKFNFKTLAKLIEEPAKEIWYSELSNILEHGGSTARRDQTISRNVRRVEKYSHNTNIDNIRALSKGLFGSRLSTVDLLREIYEEYDTSFDKELDKTLSKEPFKNLDHFLSTQEASLRCFAVTDKDRDKVPHLAAKEPDYKPGHIEDSIIQRKFQLEMINVNKVVCTLSGDPRRKVGDTIEFAIPNRYGAIDESHQPDPPNNRYLSGKYLVTAISHKITGNKYYNDVEIVKDSFARKIDPVDVIKFFDWVY